MAGGGQGQGGGFGSGQGGFGGWQPGGSVGSREQFTAARPDAGTFQLAPFQPAQQTQSSSSMAFGQPGVPPGMGGFGGGYGGGMGGFGGFGGFGRGLGGIGSFYNPFRGGFGGFGGGRFMQMPQGMMPITIAGGPQTMQMPQSQMPINVAGGSADVIPQNTLASSAVMSGGGITSLLASGGEAKADYADLLNQLPSTWGTSAQDTYNRVMDLGQSQAYQDYWNSLPSHLRAYAAPPATGPNDPNWTYQAQQQQNQWQVSQGDNPWTTPPAATTPTTGVPKIAGTKPLILPPVNAPRPKDDSGDQPTPTPTPDPTVNYTPKPSTLQVSKDYTPYTPPARQIYTPSTYRYTPSEGSAIGQNMPPKITPTSYKVPMLPTGQSMVGLPFLYRPPTGASPKPPAPAPAPAPGIPK